MKDNYEEYSKDDLVRLLRERDRKPKFGLVWERNEIDHDNSVNNDFIALDYVPELSHGDEPHKNLLIEGDNFDALRYLRMTHAGKIKCIYIDPPYNTGNKDFIYNDHFVDKDDVYKHSKWLEFMYRRLILARDLLREDGVIFVSIGEEEFVHLSLLMDQVFPGMKVATFVWRRRSGANDSKGAFVSTDHEYVLCYGGADFSFSGYEKDLSSYSNYDEGSSDPWKRGDLTKAHTYKNRPNSFYPIQNPENKIWYPANPQRVWLPISRQFVVEGKKAPKRTMEDLLESKKVIFPSNEDTVSYSTYEELLSAIDKEEAPKFIKKNLYDDSEKNKKYLKFWVGKEIGFGSPGYKRNVSEVKSQEKPVSTWIVTPNEKLKEEDIEVIVSGMTQEGTRLIQQMLGSKAFSYPKPLSLISALIKQSTNEEDLIIDFFAGSATTAHAVMSVNQENDGNRKFIMVSSTEATADEPNKNICRDVAQKRLVAAIDGYSYKSKKGLKGVEGLDGEFAYLRTKHISTQTMFTEIQHDQIWTALQLIHENGFGDYDDTTSIQMRESENSLVAYIPKLTNESLSIIQGAIKGKSNITLYSWQPALLKQRIENSAISFEPIPQFLTDRFGIGG